MKTLLHKDGDVYFDGVAENQEAIRNSLRDRLSIVKGEYMPNVMLGLPIGATQEEIDLNVQQIILGTSGVTGILKFNSNIVDKIYRCRFEASTIYGRLIYE